MANYASADKLRESWRQVSEFNSWRNDANIISQVDERTKNRHQYDANDDSRRDFCRFLGLDDQEISRPSYYEEAPRRLPHMRSMGRGRLLQEAAEASGNYNSRFINDRKLKQQMYQAGICSTSNVDLKAHFIQMYKKKDDDLSEESGLTSPKPPSTYTSPSEISSGEFDDDDEIKFPPLRSDFNNDKRNDNKKDNNDEETNERKGRLRKSSLKPVKTSIYVPPHRRNSDDDDVGKPVTVPVEEKEDVGFADSMRKTELKKLQSRPVVRRKTPAELLADPMWDEKPKENVVPKCRNAVMLQFMPKCETSAEVATASASSSCSTTEESSPVSWLLSDKTSTARRLIDSFVPAEEAKPRNFTLGDFIVNKSPKKKSPNKM